MRASNNNCVLHAPLFVTYTSLVCSTYDYVLCRCMMNDICYIVWSGNMMYNMYVVRDIWYGMLREINMGYIAFYTPHPTPGTSPTPCYPPRKAHYTHFTPHCLHTPLHYITKTRCVLAGVGVTSAVNTASPNTFKVWSNKVGSRASRPE